MVDPIIYADITQRIHEVYRALERFDYSFVERFFTPDCKCGRNGNWRQGHEAILAALNERPANRMVRHVIASISVEPEGDGFLVQYSMFSAHNDGAPESTPPFSTTETRLIGDATDRLVWRDGQLKFQEMDGQFLFQAPA